MFRVEIYFQLNIITSMSMLWLRMLNSYKRIQIQVEMDLNRNPNFWAFITDFIKPDLYSTFTPSSFAKKKQSEYMLLSRKKDTL